MDALQTDQRIERTRISGSLPSQNHPTPMGWFIACIAASSIATADNSTPPDLSALRPDPLLTQLTSQPNSTIYEFRLEPGAASATDTCATGLEAPELHPSKIDSEIHLTWHTTAGTLYTVELSTDQLEWKLGPHLIGDGEVHHYYLLDNFGPLEKSGLVRLNTYPDPLADPDGDGLDTLSEVTTSRTSPYSADSDSDGVYDAHETAQGTNPNAPDLPGGSPLAPNTNLIVYRPH